MGLRRVGADDPYQRRALQLRDRVAHRPPSYHDRQTGDRGGVSGTGAVIDVVGADNRAGELLEQVVRLADGAGGGPQAEGVRAVTLLYVAEAGGHQVQRLVPGGLAEAAVGLDQGRGQPVRAADEVPGELPLHAEGALVRGGAEVRRRAYHFAAGHVQVDAAAGAAEVAHRGHARDLFRPRLAVHLLLEPRP